MKTSGKFWLGLLLGVLAACSGAERADGGKFCLRPFSAEDVVLRPSWIAQRESLNVAYLKSLDADRLLHNFRVNAGLPSSAEPLGGWEAPYIGLRGHFVGHYLSAVSSVVRHSGDSLLSSRLEYLVDELQKCQAALGNGYLSAFPERDFDVLEQTFGGVWAPYYTYHKIMQGLLDVYRNTGNRKAYDMLLGMADYVDRRMSRLDEETVSKMLYTPQANPANEPGAMNEVLYELYALSHDEKHLKLARRFDRNWFLLPLAAGEDILSGLHANTHIVLVNGFAEGYEQTGNPLYRDAVTHFWDMLMTGHAYVNGSSSGPRPNVTTPTSFTSEHWGLPGHLANTLTREIAESCVTHNTQKLTARLLTWTQEPKYAEAYMNTFYNAVMALQNRETGDVVYHLPLGSPRNKKFLNGQTNFRCCNGSSIEAFSLLENNIYFHHGDSLWITQYLPTDLHWKERGLTLSQTADLVSSQQAVFTFSLEQPCELPVSLFIPSWSRETRILVNGEPAGEGTPGSFFTLVRQWHDSDRLELRFSFDFRIARMPDDDRLTALFYGPMLLAFRSPGEIWLEGSPEELLPHLQVADSRELSFTLDNGGTQYRLKPLFRIVDEPYSVYVRTGRLTDDYRLKN